MFSTASNTEGTIHVRIVVFLALFTLIPVRGVSQEAPTGLEVGILPAVNFDADEGFGYGALAELYQYGSGGLEPYAWSVRPTVFLTTEGRRDVTVFFDGPHVIPGGWRLDVFLGSEKQIATPYYGLGNQTVYDPALEDEDTNPFYYRFGRERLRATVNLQRRVTDSPLRWLVGFGLERAEIDPVPENDGTTLYQSEVSETGTTESLNYVRSGLVWDSRDRETGPHRGTWTEFLVQRVDEALGADLSYTRWTFADRRYVPLGERLVFAHRYLLQGTSAGAPVFDLFRVQTSFQLQEGLGGAKTVRGILKDRFVGRGILVWNAELRWRAVDFRMIGKPFYVVLSAFLDQGRVWSDGVRLDELFSDLHRGVGGGVRLTMGEDFVVAVDAGHSGEAGVQIYIGLGYLY